MTPTPTVVLLIALFWTLPASAAVLTYRKHDSSIDNVKASVAGAIGAIAGPELQPQPDA